MIHEKREYNTENKGFITVQPPAPNRRADRQADTKVKIDYVLWLSIGIVVALGTAVVVWIGR